jgi:tetratricopeptide (TPR) repeat protein
LVGEVGKSLADREQINKLARRFYTTADVPFPMLHNHAWVLLRMGRAQQALTVIDAAIERARSANNPPQLVQMLHYKAWAHLDLQQLELAASTLEEAEPLVQQRAAAPNLASPHRAVRRRRVAAAPGQGSCCQ